MISYLVALSLKSIILFLQNSYGTIVSPYKTYRRLAASRHFEQLLPLGGLVIFYFWWASAVRVGVRHPLILTKNWILTSIAASVTFIYTVAGVYLVGKILRGKGTIINLILPWGYSLLPTLAWFYVTSVSFFVLPPPRTLSLAGRMFSFAFIVGSLALFLWKGILYYLTLRFGMRLDLRKILAASAIIFPSGIVYSLFMYRLGIFRVPFI